ncbi:MAG: M23 family metallopeptidase [Deltaproteobacteria bacterium]|nr:M23 family metallopeptidase [Deltaproteobacteria bacterium]
MKKFNLFYIKISIAILVIAALGWVFFGSYVEIGKPVIKFTQEVTAIGRQKTIEINFSDSQSGLSHLNVEIIQDSKGQILADKKIPSKGQKQEIFSLSINTVDLKLHDGPAVIKITATDYSLFKNQTVLSLAVRIDTIPPQVNLLKTVNYINQGGTGFVAYQSSKNISYTGVYVNDCFTPGHKTLIDNKASYVTYFAVPIDANKSKTRIMILARDNAGNETNLVFPCVIKEKKFRHDKMNLSENFLQQKMPEFQGMVPSLQGKTPLEVFTYINSQMRNDNLLTIQKICQKSSPKALWEGTFLRMSNAAPMALFGDKRDYVFDKKVVGQSIHTGVDLASNAQAAIEAANSGIVVFTGVLGIYGNAVIIDHGQGLFSLYGHLSVINTTVGKNLAKGEKIGNSGTSGLAGGDHLHFSIIAGGQFVNPQEWWDPHWIKDNINK